MASVWILTSGDYSTIEGVFSSEEAALEAMDLDPSLDWNDPVEWDVDDTTVICDEGHAYGPIYRVFIDVRSGHCRRDDYVDKDTRHPEDCSVHGDYADTTTMSVVSPIGYEHAEKVAVEKRQEHLRTQAQGAVDGKS